jgi:hypothetical protein
MTTRADTVRARLHAVSLICLLALSDGPGAAQQSATAALL